MDRKNGLVRTQQKLSPCYIGPYDIVSIIYPSVDRLRLLRIKPTFHVSQLNLVSVSALYPPASPPPPSRVVDSYPAFTVQRL